MAGPPCLYLRPQFHVLSNGALVFAVSLILCTKKWVKLFAKTVIAFNSILAYRTDLTENQVHHSKEPSILIWRNIKILHLLLYFCMSSTFEGHGKIYKPVCIYTRRAYKQFYICAV